jgi:hypothetical protein
MLTVLELSNSKAEENLDMTSTCYTLTLQASNWYDSKGDLFTIQTEPYVSLLVSKLRQQIPATDYLAVFADQGLYDLLSKHEVVHKLDRLVLRSTHSITDCLFDVFATFPDCDQVTWINSRQLSPCINEIIAVSDYLAHDQNIGIVLSSAEDITARFINGTFITQAKESVSQRRSDLPFFDRENLLLNNYYTRSFFALKKSALSTINEYMPEATLFLPSRKPLFVDDLLNYVDDDMLGKIILSWLLSNG